MVGIVVVVALVAALGAWGRFQHTSSRGRMMSPMWLAFTATALSILFLTAGAVGYKINHGMPFMVPTAWTDHVIWRQIWVGAGAAVASVFLWRAGLRSLRP
jgi:hypothetical protein